MQGKQKRVPIRLIPTGVPGLDDVLGGGIPAYSLNIVGGQPGSGKTTMVQQIVFHNATAKAPALMFLALGEPGLKLLRYQQQFQFFDPAKVDKAVFYIDLGKTLREEGLARTLDRITKEVEKHNPRFVAIDSFKGLEETATARGENVRGFVQDFASTMAAWEVTSFLVGEYTLDEILTMPESSVADGIIYLTQETRQNTITVKLQAIKMRGQSIQRGKHTFKIDETGVRTFPRMTAVTVPVQDVSALDRAAFGVAGLDEMMKGGVPRGQSVLVAGSSGTGKTLLALHFIAEGVKEGEPGVMATFEEHPREHERKARAFGWDLPGWQKKNMLGMVYIRPMDLSPDEVMQELRDEVARLKAKRVVINSISGFEMGLAPTDAEDFRESLYRLVASLTADGVTTLMTTEIAGLFGDVPVSPHGSSFISDNIILLRYVEIESELRKAVVVQKMRTSAHAKELRQFDITSKGFVVEQPFTKYSGIFSGMPSIRLETASQPFVAGLTDEESNLVRVLIALREATAQVLADSLGEDLKQVQQALNKLVDTGYVVRSGTKEQPTYRVALVTPGMIRK